MPIPDMQTSRSLLEISHLMQAWHVKLLHVLLLQAPSWQSLPCWPASTAAWIRWYTSHLSAPVFVSAVDGRRWKPSVVVDENRAKWTNIIWSSACANWTSLTTDAVMWLNQRHFNTGNEFFTLTICCNARRFLCWLLMCELPCCRTTKRESPIIINGACEDSATNKRHFMDIKIKKLLV